MRHNWACGCEWCDGLLSFKDALLLFCYHVRSRNLKQELPCNNSKHQWLLIITFAREMIPFLEFHFSSFPASVCKQQLDEKQINSYNCCYIPSWSIIRMLYYLWNQLRYCLLHLSNLKYCPIKSNYYCVKY